MLVRGGPVRHLRGPKSGPRSVATRSHVGEPRNPLRRGQGRAPSPARSDGRGQRNLVTLRLVAPSPPAVGRGGPLSGATAPAGVRGSPSALQESLESATPGRVPSTGPAPKSSTPVPVGYLAWLAARTWPWRALPARVGHTRFPAPSSSDRGQGTSHKPFRTQGSFLHSCSADGVWLRWQGPPASL